MRLRKLASVALFFSVEVLEPRLEPEESGTGPLATMLTGKTVLYLPNQLVRRQRHHRGESQLPHT